MLLLLVCRSGVLLWLPVLLLLLLLPVLGVQALEHDDAGVPSFGRWLSRVRCARPAVEQRTVESGKHVGMPRLDGWVKFGLGAGDNACPSDSFRPFVLGAFFAFFVLFGCFFFCSFHVFNMKIFGVHFSSIFCGFFFVYIFCSKKCWWLGAGGSDA
jgi:hypothetical protein